MVDGTQVRRPGTHRRGGTRPTAEAVPPNDAGRVRRLAAVAAGRLHEAARQMLGSGHGGLTAAAFDTLFPGAWARAVLGERLLVPAGGGYRPAYEEFGEWLQGLHLDLDGALRLLLGETQPPADEGTAVPGPWAPADGPVDGTTGHGVPRHRVRPVAAALERLGRTWGATALDPWLHRLWRALETAPPGSEPAWWAGRLLAGALVTGPDLTVHRVLLERLAEREQPPGFGPAFWAALPLAPAARLDLLRRLVRTDGAGQPFRAATAELLAADPQAVIPLVCRWFEDSRRLLARPGTTVADVAHDLLHAHRRLALDDLTECLVDTAHPRADALLSLLAEDEPSALCRAVDRWSHDPRPERHVAAAVHALRTAPHAAGPGSELLHFTAVTLLAREDEPALHGAALALLVRDPQTRTEHLPAALAAYEEDDPFVTAEVLAPALDGDLDLVLAAFRRRLAAPGGAVAEGLRVLAGAADPAVARRGMELAAELLRERPERAAQVAEYLDRLLAREADPGPLLDEVVTGQPAVVRRVFAVLLAAPGRPPSLLDTLLATECDASVLAAVLERLAESCTEFEPGRLRALLRRVVEGCEEAVLVRCAGRSADFARLLAEWPAAEPALGPGPLLARMRALVAAGRDPQYAAAEAERGALRPPPRSGGLPVPKQGRAHGTL